jgi:hypothetical protein
MDQLHKEHLRTRAYLPRASEAAWTGPSDFRDVTIYGVAVKANATRVNEALQRYIARPSQNLGRRIDVCAITDHVLFLFIDSMRHQPSGGSEGGSEGSHQEQLFAVVVFGYRMRPSPGPVLFAPYIYASMTPGWRVEREIYGYPQQLGQVSIPKAKPKEFPPSLRVKAAAIARFKPDARSGNREILRIERRRGVPEKVRDLTKEEIAKVIAGAMKATSVPGAGPGASVVAMPPRVGFTAGDAAFFRRRGLDFPRQPAPDPDPVDLRKALLSGSFRMLFLKQFRDVGYADRACYQAIVEAPTEIRDYKGGVVAEDYQLTLRDIDSAPICRELGIPSGVSRVPLAFRVDLGAMSIGDPKVPAKVISNPYWNPAEEPAVPGGPSHLPKYVDRGGEAVWRQPSLLSGARMFGFGVPVDVRRQQAHLNQYVNDVAAHSNATYGLPADDTDPFRKRPFRLSPCTSLVMLLFVDYQLVISATDDDSRLGGTKYREFLAMQLALSDDDEFPELDWFIPFVYLDADSPRLCGREIYGYPKQLCTISGVEHYKTRGGPIGPVKRLNLRGTVIHRRLNSDALKSQSIVKVVGPPRAPAIQRPYLSADEMVLDLLRIGDTRSGAGNGDGSGELNTRILNALLFNNIGNVFLKQFRDCTRPETACYKAVCKTDTVPGRFHGGGRLDPRDYRITIQDHASEPLIGYLKGPRATGGPVTLQPSFAYWLDLDFELTTGRVIANPFETDYVPDRTGPAGLQQLRPVHRTGQPDF